MPETKECNCIRQGRRTVARRGRASSPLLGASTLADHVGFLIHVPRPSDQLLLRLRTATPYASQVRFAHTTSALRPVDERCGVWPTACKRDMHAIKLNTMQAASGFEVGVAWSSRH